MLISLQPKMDQIHDSCILNRLTINEFKIKYMVVISEKVEPLCKISVGR